MFTKTTHRHRALASWRPGNTCSGSLGNTKDTAIHNDEVMPKLKPSVLNLQPSRISPQRGAAADAMAGNASGGAGGGGGGGVEGLRSTRTC